MLQVTWRVFTNQSAASIISEPSNYSNLKFIHEIDSRMSNQFQQSLTILLWKATILDVAMWLATSVTRFSEISPLWQIFEH